MPALDPIQDLGVPTLGCCLRAFARDKDRYSSRNLSGTGVPAVVPPPQVLGVPILGRRPRVLARVKDRYVSRNFRSTGVLAVDPSWNLVSPSWDDVFGYWPAIKTDNRPVTSAAQVCLM